MASLRQISLPIAGLDCVDCARTLEGGVSQLTGVESSQLDFGSATLRVAHDPQRTSLCDIVKRVSELGYDVAAQEWTFDLAGLDCADCAAKVEQAVAALPGVLEAQVVFATAQLRVRGLADKALAESIRQRVAELGYRAQQQTTPAAATTDSGQNLWTRLQQNPRRWLTVASGALLGLASLLRLFGRSGPAVVAAYALAILCGGYYVARSGWAAWRTTRTLDMNALMTIAAIGAVAIGEWAEGATAMFLFSLGNTLEAMSMDRARQAIRTLLDLSPKQATRLHGDHADVVPIEQLQIGDLIVVKPGEKLPMDGVVDEGQSALNQAPITGESTPVDVSSGSSVYAGSINGQGALYVRVTRLAEDNTLARIVKMVQKAQASQAPAQRFVDTFARYYTPAVIALATAVAVVPPLVWGAPFSLWFYRALVLLVISCPCALVISTPVAIVSAISSAARRGVLIKGGRHLEAIAGIRAVAFDKTGTLTQGVPAVTDVELLNSQPPPPEFAELTPEGLLSMAASVEAHSRHPLAQAIAEEAHRRGLRAPLASGFEELTGRGARARWNGTTIYVGSHTLFTEAVPHPEVICRRVAELEAQGKTALLVGTPEHVLGIIALADPVREDAPQTVRALSDVGLGRISLLSGDNEPAAQAIAEQVGIADVHANLLPQDKVGAVDQLLAENGSVAMIGDGVNDAPALARATVGVAMGAAGSDVALETADIVLMSDDLTRIPYVMRLGRRTLHTIKANIALSLAIKGLFLLLAIAGAATLWMAVFADMGTSLIVTLNGLRLLREAD
jgi:Cd2+/Zn2+-exporting ATPase